jgi:hypothetical protein
MWIQLRSLDRRQRFRLRSPIHKLIHKEQRFQRRSLGQLRNPFRMEPFRLRSLDQLRNLIRKEPFRLRTKDRKPMYHSKSSKLRNLFLRGGGSIDPHRSFDR